MDIREINMCLEVINQAYQKIKVLKFQSLRYL